ncbi:MAG: serine/threonine protein kinase [Chloroflexi bacterium]|nr:MAG: serine/threonine protein kinase [Chloroflexota bacterium]
MAGEALLNNRYRLVAQQGSGGMAVIYKAIDQVLGRTVAIKILRPSLTGDNEFLERFRNEARSIANLAHPNIVTVHDVGNDGPTHYIVMEFVEGTDLKKIIRTHGSLPVERALNLAIQICSGIGFAHRAGIVHADIKPQNILVTSDDTVKVTDFGIAQALSDTIPGQRADVVWGSPHYFAPEQARGERPTPASDVYAIGIVMFEMLTGRLPYVGASQQDLALAHIRERIPLVTEYNPNVPDELAQIIYKVMSKEPSARYRMADQLGHVLEAYRDRGKQRTISGPAVSPPPAQPSVASRPTTPPPPPPAPAEQAPPTQRYSPAPQAPQPSIPQPGPTNRPQVRPLVEDRTQYTPPPAPPQVTDSRRYAPPPAYEQFYEEDAPSGLDVVTIALALIAFLAVACLFPLYIAVFQAYTG